MKYVGMPMAMWTLFRPSFQKHLTLELGLTPQQARAVTISAKQKYRQILTKLPEFEKADQFKTNLVNCAMLSAFVLSMPQRPSVEDLTAFYSATMMTPLVRYACRLSGKKQYTPQNLARMQATADLKAADRNPYSWNMDFYPYPDNSGFEARFSRCGICTLMNELGLSNLIPAMCHFDYDMSEAGGRTDFVRQYTLASGGPYCDCGYHKKR